MSTNMMRKKIIVGNWKMHLNVQQASLLAQRLNQHIKLHRNIEVVLAPSMLALQPMSLQVDRRKFRLAAQNAFYIDEGAYTGEVSFAMLREIVHYAIVGHSERRLHFHEDLPMIRDKVAACVRNEIVPILCVGETKREHEARETKRVVHDQLTTAIHGLTSETIDSLVVAYEPVWAIGTGRTATPEIAEEAHAFIREELRKKFGNLADAIRILYGGSVKPENARTLFAEPDIDGGLIGGASLDASAFIAIVEAAT